MYMCVYILALAARQQTGPPNKCKYVPLFQSSLQIEEEMLTGKN